MLVHHRHAILGERTDQSWEGRQASLPSQCAKNGTIRYKNYIIVQSPSWLIACWTSGTLLPLFL